VAFLAVNNFGDTRSGGLAGPMGLFIIVLLSIATVLLIRNMNKRLRRLPDSFEKPGSAEYEAEMAQRRADRGWADAAAGSAGFDGDRSAATGGGDSAQVSDGTPAARPTGAEGRGAGA
jgi:hypothetical protein